MVDFLRKFKLLSFLISQKNKMVAFIQGVWYMRLKIENMCLKTCIEICVGEKVCGNTYNIV